MAQYHQALVAIFLLISAPDHSAAGDRSPRRLAQSAGVMVNYLYDRAEIEQNHEAFARSQLITVAPAIHDLLRPSGDQATAGVRVSRRASRLKRMILRP